MPYVLDKLRDDHYDIRKAHIKHDSAVLYVKDGVGDVHHKLHDIIADGYHDSYQKNGAGTTGGRIILPHDAEVNLYNLPNARKTTLEFSCVDRIGLLGDILELLAVFPFELQNSYISTVGPFAHNLFFLQACKKSLKEEDLEYIRNVFEYEVKRGVSNV